MKKEDSMTEVTERQSYIHMDKLEDANDYNGLDHWKKGEIADTRLYAFVPDFKIEGFLNGEDSPTFWFDQATYDAFVDPKTGEFDAQKLAQALQVKPFQNDKMREKGYAEYKTSILAIDVKRKLEVPVAYCYANDQYGGGGGHQYFISLEKMKECLANGTLRYNLDATLRKTGKNERITNQEYDLMKKASNKRIRLCEKEIARVQETDPDFKGPVNPNPKDCPHPFELNKPIPGAPGRSAEKTNWGMAEYQKSISQRKEANQKHSGSARAEKTGKAKDSQKR